MKKTRALTTLLMAALALCLVALPGCGKSPEDTIRESLTAGLEALREGADEELVKSMEAGADGSFKQLGLDTEEYAAAYLEGFAYEIGEVEVDKEDGTAVAHVTITIKSMQDILTDFQTKFEEALYELDAFPAEDELMKLGGEAMMAATDAAEPQSTDVELGYTLDGEEWVPDEGTVQEELAAALL